MPVPVAPSLLAGAIEMTATGISPAGSMSLLNTAGARLDTSVNLTTGGPCRIDISAQGVMGKATINVLFNGVVVGSITVTEPGIALYSTWNSSIAAGPYTLSLQLSNYSMGSNTAAIGLVYVTQTAHSSPEVYDTMPAAVIEPDTILTSNHFKSGLFRGFDIGSFSAVSQVAARGLSDMKKTGANIARCSVCINHGPSDSVYYYCDSITGVSTSEALQAIDNVLTIAETEGFYVILSLDVFNTGAMDIWGSGTLAAARRDSIKGIWQILATRYKDNTWLAAYNLINSPNNTLNYGEYLRWQMDIIGAICTIDCVHPIIVEAVDGEMPAMMQQLPFSNIVYGISGYEPQQITKQGVNPSDVKQNTRNTYPALTPTANLPGSFSKTELSASYDNVRTFAKTFNVPVMVDEFSCVGWALTASGGKWSSTQYVIDSIDLYEVEKWAWVYYSWRSEIDFDSEVDPSFFTQFAYTNARPAITKQPVRSSGSSTISVLSSWFTQGNAGTGGGTNTGGGSGTVTGTVNGYYGMSNPNSTSIGNLKPTIKGFFVRDISWAELEPSQGIWNWTVLDDKIKTCVDSGIPVVFMIKVGPDCPQWVYSTVPKVTTTGVSSGQATEYPYYLDPDYMPLFKNMYDTVAQHIAASYPQNWKDALLGWQSAEGSSGDLGPWKGIPITIDPNTGLPYEITDTQWQLFIREARLHLYTANTICPSVFNAGQEGQEWEWILTNCPNAGIKNGEPGHDVGYDGELITFNRPGKPAFYRTESENIQSQPWWNTQVFMAMVASCLQAGIKQFCMNATNMDRSVMEFFNRHSNGAATGFTLMHKGIDYTDTNVYPESVYGDLIPKSSAVAYNQELTNAAATYSGVHLEYINLDILKKYVNPDRVTAIQAKMSTYGAIDDPANPYRDNYGYMLFPGNYEKGLKVFNHNQQSFKWRLGPTNQPFGLTAMTFGMGLTEFYIDVDPNLTLQYNSRLRVTYYDAQGCWTLSHAGGGVTGTGIATFPTVQAKGTDQWATKEFNLAGFDRTGMNGHAFRIQKCSSSSVYFGMLEIA